MADGNSGNNTSESAVIAENNNDDGIVLSLHNSSGSTTTNGNDSGNGGDDTWPTSFEPKNNHPSLLTTYSLRFKRLQSEQSEQAATRSKPPSSWVLFVHRVASKQHHEGEQPSPSPAQRHLHSIKRLFWRFVDHTLSMFETEDPSDSTPAVLSIPIEKILGIDVVKQVSSYSTSPTSNDSSCSSLDDLVYNSHNEADNPTYPVLYGGRLEHIFAIRTPTGSYYCGTSPKAEAGEKIACFEFALAIRKHVGHACSTLCSCGVHHNPHYIREFYDMHSTDLVGQGEFGRVCKAIRREDGKTVVVKVINALKNQVKSHARTPKGVDHPGVVTPLDFYFTPDHVYCVMEHLPRNLLELLLELPQNCMDERRAKFIVQQVLAGLSYLHSISIVHGDLKLENILVVDSHPFPQIKISDFGYLRIIKERCFQQAIIDGSREYIPPEGFTTEPRFDKAFDLWSVGVVSYALLSGVFPYNPSENIANQIRDRSILYPVEYWGNISADATSFISHLLNEAVWYRLRSCYQALKLSWISQDYISWCDMRQLEARVGAASPSRTVLRYCTQEEEDERWDQLCATSGLPSWQEIGCRSDSKTADAQQIFAKSLHADENNNNEDNSDSDM